MAIAEGVQAIERRTIAKVSWRLLPLVALAYCIAYIDRSNISFAALTMNKDLGFSAYIYGWGAGIFFFGYFLFEIPSNLVLEKVGARIWIARIMITWGIISGLTAFVTGTTSFLIIRFLLGAAEAGFFPGMILYFTYWFPSEYRGRVISTLFIAQPVANAVASVVSAAILEMDGVVIEDTRVNCHREFLLNNALIDCYGYYRPDIEVLYPGFQQVPNVGFQFFVDVGDLITQRGFVEGAHILQIKALDKEDSSSLLKEVPIVMECATANLDPPPIGFIDDPTNYKFIGGVYPVVGWALDLDLVVKVRILIDGVAQIDAVRGVDYAELGFASPDVAVQYPAYPQASNARFRFYLDTTQISNSEHDLLIEVTNGNGNVRSAGTRRFLVDNNTLVR